MSDTDFAALIEPVARHLWGEPAKVTKHSIRWGNNGSKAIDLQKGVWFDHEAQEGGSVLDLVMREIACDKAGAVEWLQSEGFIPPRENAHQPPHERHPSPSPSDDAPTEERQSAAKSEATLVPVKGYHYTDRDGNVLYDVIRYNFRLPDGSFESDEKTGDLKKTFRQRRPNGRGGHIWNLEGIGHTIYRHPDVEVAIAEGKPIWLVEGEKDADTLGDWGLCATTNSGGAKHWTDAMAQHLRGADVIILPDNDDAGRAGAEKKALSLRGIAKRVRVLDLANHVSDLPKKGDVTDWRDKAGGSAAKLGEILNTLPDWSPAPPVSAFSAMTIADAVKRGHRAHSWLVQDLIELGGSCSFAGFTQSGKSFLVIELAFCVARGLPFFGRDVKQGLVIYQVGEGATGFLKRVEGYAQDRAIENREAIPLVILPQKINLFVDDKDTDALIAECKAWEAYHGIKLRMLVIDTFNKATRGSNEISGQDNGKINDRVERIARECDCTVVVVDHLSAQGRLRGHTSKSDDMTTCIKVLITERADGNNRKVRKLQLDKNKDGENGLSISFVLRQVSLGFDDAGHPVTTCVVDAPDGDEEELTKQGKLSLNQSQMLRTIKDTAEIEGERAPAEMVHVPPGRNVAKWTAFLARARKTWQFKESDPQKREAELTRIVADAGKRLQLAGFIDRDNERGLIWWTGKEDRPRPEPKVDKPSMPASVKAEIADMGVPF